MKHTSVTNQQYTAANKIYLDEQHEARHKLLTTESLAAVKRHGSGLDPQMHGVIRNAFYSGANFGSKSVL